MERRRKELLLKLEDIQGDTRREKPPKFEESPEKETKSTPPVIRRTSQSKGLGSTKSDSDSSSTVTSPNRDSKLVNNLVSGFETLHASAKKEEEEETPKKWQVELRKTRKPADFPGEEKPSKEEEGDKKDDQVDTKDDKVKEAKESLQESNELKPEPEAHHGSSLSLDSTGSAEPDATPTKSGKKKNKLQGLFKKKRGKGDKSPVPTRKEISATAEEPGSEPTPTENGKEEDVEVAEAEAEPEEVEEGVRVSGKLEHKVKARLTTKFVPKDVKLKETTLYIGDKETLSMLGCTVQSTDSGFELFSHSTQKAYTFKVTEGGAELKEKWLTAIQAAIEEVTPKVEGK